jgi:hypothetical protein
MTDAVTMDNRLLEDARLKAVEYELMCSTAIHEAGHAVFRWRNGEMLYGDAFVDLVAPFDEIIISPCLMRDAPPLVTADGREMPGLFGVVIRHGFRRPVHKVRHMQRTPHLSRTQHREWIKDAKTQAYADVIATLAGPVVQAGHDVGPRNFYWQDELDAETLGDGYDDSRRWPDYPSTDVAHAVAIAAQELCRGWRQTVACMDKAVAHIEAKLASDPRYLSTILTLAETLEERHRLDGDEAVALMLSFWRGEG